MAQHDKGGKDEKTQNIDQLMCKIDEVLQANVAALKDMIQSEEIEKPNTISRPDLQSILIRSILAKSFLAADCSSKGTASEIDTIKQQLKMLGEQVVQLTTTVNASIPSAQLQKDQQETNASLQEAVKNLVATSQRWAAVASHPKQVAPEFSQHSPKEITEALRSTLLEHQKENERKLNVVVFGLKEGDNDLDKFKSLCSREMQCNVKPIASRRIGLKSKDKIRPLLVKCLNEADRRKILGNAKLLRQSDLENVKNHIFIAPDMSKDEREKKKKLREAKRDRSPRLQNGGETLNADENLSTQGK
jgi:hypothetical protein